MLNAAQRPGRRERLSLVASATIGRFGRPGKKVALRATFVTIWVERAEIVAGTTQTSRPLSIFERESLGQRSGQEQG